MARATEDQRATMRAYRGFLRAALAYARYLRASGRLADPESEVDIAGLEAMLWRVMAGIGGADGGGRVVRLSQAPEELLGHAARGQLRRYREAVFEDSRRLRDVSAALRRRTRLTRARLLGADGGRRAIR
jgi:PAS domain-containing protein